MDLTRYIHVNLHNRRTQHGNKRCEFDEEVDFPYMVELRQAGATWEEITELLNQNRNYYTTVRSNRDLYDKKMRNIIVVKTSEDSAEAERTRLLDDLDWVSNQALRKWQELKDIQYQDEVSGLSDDSEDVYDEDDFTIKPKKKYSKKKMGLVEQHQAKYLEIVLKVVEMKAKLTGANVIERHEIDIIDLLKNKILDDGGAAKSAKITSEEEVMRIYGGSMENTLGLAIEEAIIYNGESGDETNNTPI